MTLPRYAFFKGKLVPYADARIGVLTHALNYGTAVFGGIRGYWNPEQAELFVFRPEDHFNRFLDSAKLLNMGFATSPAELVDAVRELLLAEGYEQDCYVRPLAFYADEGIGVRLHDLTPAISIVALPYGRYIENEEGVHATISSWRRVDDNTIPPRGKIAGSYVNSALAKTDAMRSGYDEAIVLNAQGHVCEGSAENIFVVRHGTVVTPPFTESILEGITRKTVIELLRDALGLTVVERPIDRTELYLSEEAFFTGTGVQIAAITRVDQRPIGTGRMGPVAARLRSLYFDVVRGRNTRYRGWCKPVYRRAPVGAELGLAASA
ncbi:MAG TPA: branched-chain amino acid transaminase [Thermoanaerobaculia bacterium]|nr:branched-chain amino acid transaminase [Thermoanaerobaculia bacterium]